MDANESSDEKLPALPKAVAADSGAEKQPKELVGLETKKKQPEGFESSSDDESESLTPIRPGSGAEKKPDGIGSGAKKKQPEGMDSSSDDESESPAAASPGLNAKKSPPRGAYTMGTKETLKGDGDTESFSDDSVKVQETNPSQVSPETETFTF